MPPPQTGGCDLDSGLGDAFSRRAKSFSMIDEFEFHPVCSNMLIGRKGVSHRTRGLLEVPKSNQISRREYLPASLDNSSVETPQSGNALSYRRCQAMLEFGMSFRTSSPPTPRKLRAGVDDAPQWRQPRWAKLRRASRPTGASSSCPPSPSSLSCTTGNAYFTTRPSSWSGRPSSDGLPRSQTRSLPATASSQMPQILVDCTATKRFAVAAFVHPASEEAGLGGAGFLRLAGGGY